MLHDQTVFKDLTTRVGAWFRVRVYTDVSTSADSLAAAVPIAIARTVLGRMATAIPAKEDSTVCAFGAGLLGDAASGSTLP